MSGDAEASLARLGGREGVSGRALGDESMVKSAVRLVGTVAGAAGRGENKRLILPKMVGGACCSELIVVLGSEAGVGS